MTSIVVGGGGYEQASDYLLSANTWAAKHTAELAGTLAGTGAMAGDSSIAGDFAAAYDEAAMATLDALCDVVGATASLCRLVVGSYENHTRAELASIRSAAIVSTEPTWVEDRLHAMPCYALPSVLGGDASFLPDWANVILDHVEGFVWPDADVDRLRSTATAWRAAAGQVDDVVRLIWDASRSIQEERSPEVMIASGAIGDLALRSGDLAVVCEQLAGVCDDYATQVEQQRELILDLVRDLIRDALAIAALGFVVGVFTGGTANAVAAWINGGKLAAQVPRFHALVDALRLYAAGVAATLRTTSAQVARVAVDLQRWHRARVVYYGSERGAASVARTGGKSWLKRHEGGAMKAHTLSKHVGKSDDFLRRRLAREPNKPMVSTFVDERTAERAVRSTLRSHASAVENWMASTKQKKVLTKAMHEPVGRVMHQGGATELGTKVKVVLVKDPSMPEGYRIFTSMVFP